MSILTYLLAILCPPCPAWCTLPAGHAPDDADPDDGSVITVHRATVLADDPAGRRIDLQQSVTSYPDGTRSAEPPVILLDGRADESLSAGQARRHAAALTLAADLLDAGTDRAELAEQVAAGASW